MHVPISILYRGLQIGNLSYQGFQVRMVWYDEAIQTLMHCVCVCGCFVFFSSTCSHFCGFRRSLGPLNGIWCIASLIRDP